MGSVLAENCVGEKLPSPQPVPVQTTVHLTPWFLESLATVAATPHGSLGVMAVGGVKPGVKVTAMAGGVEFWLPQADSTATATVIGNNRPRNLRVGKARKVGSFRGK